ncbi:hypothetical protein ONA91_17560 [Micromonospora sp. DR5-3]|uniref:hypothetical protein n=1 Tax=unclassified Micromonospora TaxID=2617518 RepID=UPI0011D37264|nr:MULTISPECIES: hypothetical protein [unclassified Micromonospora]MCW3816254.1 hypothetical protein [Micromonospora sp. DR5-3]TYC23931.1 hypothetical protein FXF52_12920 [Micromonospora sp. MP36]
MPIPPRRSPLPPILLVLVPLALLQILWRSLPMPDTDAPRLVNGVLVLSPPGWLEVAVVAVAWTWAVTAGVAALAGADRPLRRALRLLPTVGAALAAGVATVLAALFLLGQVLPADVGLVWFVGVLLAVPVVLLLIRQALVLPLAVFEDLRWAAARRRAFSGVGSHLVHIAILLLIGVLAPAVLTAWAVVQGEALVAGRLPGLAFWLGRDALLVLLAVLQAATFVGVYRNLPQPRLALAHAVSRRAAPGWHRAARALAPLTLLLPMLFAGGLAAAGQLAEVSVQTRPEHGTLVALAWPAGRHPVLVTQAAVEDCLDDQCHTTRRTKLPVMLSGTERAAVAADGSVYLLTDDRLAYCDPQRVCQRAPNRLDAIPWPPRGAIALAPNGQILIAVAVPGSGAEKQHGTVREDSELRLVRCRDVRCADPTVTRLGTVQEDLARPSSPYYRELLVVVDRSGRPVVAYRPAGGSTVWIASCESPACTSARLGPQGEPATPSEEELAALHFDRLVHPCQQCTSAVSATAARPGGGSYAVAVMPGPPGARLQVGSQVSGPRRAVLWVCADFRCLAPREIPLTAVEPWAGGVSPLSPRDVFLVAANPDGRVVAARRLWSDQIVTVRP